MNSTIVRKLLVLAVVAGTVLTATICLAQTTVFFNVKAYGARGDGVNLDSPAVNSAIQAVGAAGGGTVYFPSGTYYCGSIHLTNNLTIYLETGAVVTASSTNIDLAESNPYSQYQDYGHSHFQDSLFWGENLTNVTFAGPGEINGNGKLATGNPVAGQGDKAISLARCTNIVISGITITKAGHFGILANGCSNMLVTGAQILESNARDGFNLISSSHVWVTNCVIQGSDDSMVLKSDYALGQKINSQDIHIVNCQILSTENNALQFGSETVGDFRNVTWSNIIIGGAGKAGIGITSQDGSVIDGVTYDNIIMSNCACPIFLKLDYRTTDSPNPSVGRIRNISINNVVATHSTLFNRTNTSTINGYWDGANTYIPIENITFNNVNVSNIGNNPASMVTNNPAENQDWQPQNFGKWPCYGWYLRFCRNISFTNCQTHFDNNDDRAAVVTETTTNIVFNGLVSDVGAASPYDMSFRDTAGYEVFNAVATNSTPLRQNVTNSTTAAIVLPPYFTPGDGIYATAQSVTMASGTAGAVIYYTTDGSTPASTNGSQYAGPVSIAPGTVLKAIATSSGVPDSAVNTAIYLAGVPSVNITAPPVTSFSYEAESLTYATNGAVAVVQTDSSSSGGEWLALEATNIGPYITYNIPAILPGTYDLQMEWKGNTSRGILSFALDGVILGANLDQYSTNQTYPTTDYGNVTFSTYTGHTIQLTVVGKNSASTSYWLSADRFLFSLVQPPSPAIGSVHANHNGSFQLTASGYPTLPYVIQMSTNLAVSNWVTVGTVSAAGNGSISFTDTNTTGQSIRFYRLFTP